MAAHEQPCVVIVLVVTVHVNPREELLARINESGDSFSITDVVRAEIESNLESVSYVRHVSIT